MAAVATYAFKDVVVLVNGVPITGFADGDDAISVQRDVPAFTKRVGADGDVLALKSADRSGMATFKLLQSSLSNTTLTALLKIQDAGVLAPIAFSVKDLNGLDLVIAEAAFVEGPPTMVWGAGHNAREWKLVLASVDIFAAGVA
jgi:hypothetical protein